MMKKVYRRLLIFLGFEVSSNCGLNVLNMLIVYFIARILVEKEFMRSVRIQEEKVVKMEKDVVT